MSETVTRGLLVGVDGSEQGLAAVEWAAAEAAARNCRLTVCYVSDVGAPVALPLTPELLTSVDRHSGRILAGGLARASRVAPDVSLGSCVVNGAPAAALAQVGNDADEIVVGHRGLGGFAHVLLGSVSGQVAAHASVPVVVIRPATKPDGPVVVGIDKADGHHPSLRYAFEHAARHGVGVQVVHAFHDPIAVTGLSYGLPEVDDGQVRQAAADFVRDATAPWRMRFPRLDIEEITLGGAAANTLVECSLGASLLVVGRRGVAGLMGLLLGSVAQSVIRHAHCPVAVVGGTGSL
ncbi:MAG TPA: universal stress protein [Mycobacteriales bacterium]|nr:universal stress protein [Mycobacteriales bacterium]